MFFYKAGLSHCYVEYEPEQHPLNPETGEYESYCLWIVPNTIVE